VVCTFTASTIHIACCFCMPCVGVHDSTDTDFA
jgi:hypothetical protein